MSWVQIPSPAPFSPQRIVTYVENIAELTILAMSMFLAAFFCLRVLVVPQNAQEAIKKLYEVEEEISQRR